MRRAFLLICILSVFLVCSGASFLDMQKAVINQRNTSSVGDGAIGDLDYGSSALQLANNYFYHDKFQPSTAGNVGHGHAYITNDGTSITVCISLHTSDGTKVLSGSKVINFSGTQSVDISMGGTYEILDSTDYYISVHVDTGFNAGNGLKYGPGGDGSFYGDAGKSCGNSLSDPEGHAATAGSNLSVYFDNTASSPSWNFIDL